MPSVAHLTYEIVDDSVYLEVVNGPGNGVVNYVFDWGDGSPTMTSSQARANFTPTEYGTYVGKVTYTVNGTTFSPQLTYTWPVRYQLQVRHLRAGVVLSTDTIDRPARTTNPPHTLSLPVLGGDTVEYSLLEFASGTSYVNFGGDSDESTVTATQVIADFYAVPAAQ